MKGASYSLNLSPYSTHQVLVNQIGKNLTVLDVGCNDGYLGASSDKTNTFYGLDYSSESVDRAKNIYREAIVYDLNNLHDLPWDIKFDVIIFADVLEHVIYPSQVLIFLIDRYLKPQGMVVVSLPNVANWQVRGKLLFGKFNYKETGIMDKTHLHFYTYETARLLVESSGLRIRKIMSGASFFGSMIARFPSFAPLLATNVILICEKK